PGLAPSGSVESGRRFDRRPTEKRPTLMTAIPKPYRHLQIFSVCLGILLVVLGVFLFAVKIEHSASGNGVVYGGASLEIISPGAGRVRLGSGKGTTPFPGLEPGTVGTDPQQLLEIEPLDGSRPILAKLPEPESARSKYWMIAECGIRAGDT